MKGEHDRFLARVDLLHSSGATQQFERDGLQQRGEAFDGEVLVERCGRLGREHGEVVGDRARVAVEIVASVELQWVDEDGNHHHVAAAASIGHQREVAVV